VSFTVSANKYEYEPVILSEGTYVRNQPIILGELGPRYEGNLSNNKKIDSVIIFVSELEYVPENLMKNFPNLRDLSIGVSIINKVLGPDFFDQGFENLERFGLQKEYLIEVLKTDVFINLPNLKVFWVAKTTVRELEEGVFRTNKKLESVIFRQSKISTLPENLFAGLENLKSVTLKVSSIKVLPGNLFLGNKFLKQLVFENTQIEELPKNLLSELLGLDGLTFGKSQIKSIPENFFKNNGNLTRISLDSNKIEKIPDGTFDGLQFLETVILVNNTCIDKNFEGKLAVQRMNAKLKNCH
jgi:Leucine-rich repeat (LRR) protein